MSHVSQRPDTHNQRYDRQLRLWASSGQSSLEKSNLLLIGANALSAQILKNLVLPGIGAFTILDDDKVDPSDLGVNFFLQPGESQDKFAAQEIARLLAEMNHGVKANANVHSPSQLLLKSPEYFTSFSLIISVNQSQALDLALSDLCWSVKPPSPQIPFLKVRSAGMVGEIKISLKELGIVETHPDSIVDLRLTRPFPQLEALADEFDLQTKDTLLHSHIPFVVIILKKLKEWREKNGALPTTANKIEFTASINAARQAGNVDEENFDQALAALGKHVWRPIASDGTGGGGVPSQVKDLFKDPECENVGPQSLNFWLMVRALKEFVLLSPTSSLPLSGSLPDMKATSAIYVQLQNAYRQKAAEDRARFIKILEKIFTKAGIKGAIGEEEMDAFVKHAGYLKLIRGKNERQRLEHPISEAAMLAFMDPVNPSTFQHHIAFLAADRFYETEGRYPGNSSVFKPSINSSGDDNRHAKRHKSETPEGSDVKMIDETGNGPEVETELMAVYARGVASRYGIDTDDEAWDKIYDAVQELLPPTTALLGGVVAQEAIKLITRQYVPADNTIIYDGIQQAIGVFRI